MTEELKPSRDRNEECGPWKASILLFLRISVNEGTGVSCLDELLRISQSSACFETVASFILFLM